MADQLSQFYESLRSEADLGRLITDHVGETVHLEYKTKRDTRVPELEETDTFHFSRALSGFANSDGGVLIWGIQSKKPGDIAHKLKPIAEHAEFVARLKKSLLQTVEPFIDGVLID